jgi:predicted permease
MAEISLGPVIWSSVKPIIKIYLILITGFLLAKKNMLTVETTRSLSDIILTVFLPCLTFNKIVANVQGSDIKDIGIICLSSVLIFGTGALCSLIVKLCTRVPKKWTGGIFAGGIFPNISDIPIAYIQTMDTGLILTEAEGEKGIAHVIIFLAMFLLCLFNLGGFRLIEYDFRETGDEESQENAPESEDKTSRANTLDSAANSLNQDEPDQLSKRDHNEGGQEDNDMNDSESDSESIEFHRPVALTEDVLRRRHNSIASRGLTPSLSRASATSQLSQASQSTTSTSHSLRSMHRVADLRRLPSQTMSDVIDEYTESENVPIEESDRARLARILTSEVGVTGEDIKKTSPSFLKKYHLSLVSFFFQNCLRPCSFTLIISLIIAFIPWTKALFVQTSVSMPNAPDELPPLNFVMDYTAYVGAASVPIALMLLGGCIARLKFGNLEPGFWLSALILVILRLCVMPIIGVLWVNRLTSAGWISEDDAILKFVICISWALPSMTTQIYFTAFLTKPDAVDKTQMDCTSFYLLIQYPILVISLPVLVTYTVKNIM